MDTKNNQKEAGLYEFDFEDISVEDVEVAAAQKAASLRQTDETAEHKAVREDPEASVEREEKLIRKRARRKGLSVSVGMLTWVKDLVIVFLIIWLIFAIAGFEKVEDNNNEPTMTAGERVLVIKFSYKFAKPARGEMVAVRSEAVDGGQESAQDVFFGRVIGLPGDKIYIDSAGGITVNDVTLQTSYCDGTTGFIHGELSYPYIVGEDSYFILSDNPVSTIDSRYRSVGAVSLENIEGKVFGCFWPREAWRPIH